jgi:hypothetical protein
MPKCVNRPPDKTYFYKCYRHVWNCQEELRERYDVKCDIQYKSCGRLKCMRNSVAILKGSWNRFTKMLLHIHLLTHWSEPFFRRSQFCSYSRISQHFMEPEGSLPCSQEPSTVPFLSQINPIHTIPSYLRSLLIFFTHLRLGLPQRSLSFWLSHQYLMHFSSPPFVLHALSTSSSLTW